MMYTYIPSVSVEIMSIWILDLGIMIFFFTFISLRITLYILGAIHAGLAFLRLVGYFISQGPIKIARWKRKKILQVLFMLPSLMESKLQKARRLNHDGGGKEEVSLSVLRNFNRRDYWYFVTRPYAIFLIIYLTCRY